MESYGVACASLNGYAHPPGMDYSNDAPAEKVEYKWSTSALSQLQCEQT